MCELYNARPNHIGQRPSIDEYAAQLIDSTVTCKKTINSFLNKFTTTQKFTITICELGTFKTYKSNIPSLKRYIYKDLNPLLFLILNTILHSKGLKFLVKYCKLWTRSARVLFTHPIRCALKRNARASQESTRRERWAPEMRPIVDRKRASDWFSIDAWLFTQNKSSMHWNSHSICLAIHGFCVFIALVSIEFDINF